MGYIFAYVGCYAFGVLYTTFALIGNSQTASVFQAKFGWTDDETIFYNSIINTSGIIRLTIGSFIGGPLIKRGRRKGAIISNVIAIVGAASTMIATTEFLTIGRLLVGITAGAYNVVFGKMVVENLPEKLVGKFAMVHNASMNVGIVLAFGLGFI